MSKLDLFRLKMDSKSTPKCSGCGKIFDEDNGFHVGRCSINALKYSTKKMTRNRWRNCLHEWREALIQVLTFQQQELLIAFRIKNGVLNRLLHLILVIRAISLTVSLYVFCIDSYFDSEIFKSLPAFLNPACSVTEVESSNVETVQPCFDTRVALLLSSKLWLSLSNSLNKPLVLRSM